MATFYKISGSTANGSLISPDMQQRLERGYVSITFYTDSTKNTQVQPTAGTVTFDASETGFNWGSLNNGTVDATLVAYNRPSFSGPIKNVRATCAGIVGAAFYEAVIARFGG